MFLVEKKKNLHCAPTASGAGRALPLLHCQLLSPEPLLGSEKDDLVVKKSHGELYLLYSFPPSLALSLPSNYWEPLFKFLGILTLVDANAVRLKGKNKKEF